MERPDPMVRITKPEDILVPSGYKIKVFAEKLMTPINLTFTDQGDMLIADAGVGSGNGKVLIHTSTGIRVIAEGFNPPLTGITFYKEKHLCCSSRVYYNSKTRWF
ncbi:hypothetical protein JNUCC23_09770 [Peribacillus sp. JNUCC 23]